MTSTTAAVRASVAVLAALALAACAQPGAEPTVAPDSPPPGASATATPTASPSPTPIAADGEASRVFEAQDGAVRFTLPEGWSVDDRSAMHEASEMYDNGPGWLNELVVLDEDGDRMLWYREDYGHDVVACDFEPPEYERIEIAPLASADSGTTYVQAQVAEAHALDARSDPGAWSVAMEVVTMLPEEDGCFPFTDALWTGSRVAYIDVVGDAEREDGIPDPTIDFSDEQSARAWLGSAEHDAIIGVLQSLELTDAPLLDAAP